MTDFSKMMLGKQAPFFHPLIPKMSSLILPSTIPLPPPPTTLDYTTRVKTWPMFDNDKLGDCTIATVGHLIELYTSYTKPSPVIMLESDIIKAYEQAGNYNPANPATDQGAVISAVLNRWMTHGYACDGRTDKIAGFARINRLDISELKYTMWWFGGCYMGIQLPLAWQTTTNWSMPPNTSGKNAPGSWGGHAVPIVAYDDEGLTVISWGEKIKVDWKAYQTYSDEAWAVISPDFVNSQGMSPAHFDWAYLLAGMAHIQAGF